jgi:aspartate/methionine/tyrosine aminotransferase
MSRGQAPGHVRAVSDRIGSLWVEEQYAARRAVSGGQAPGQVLRLRGSAARPLPPHVREAAIAALAEHDRTPPSRGLSELREALGRLHGRDPEHEVLVTSGAQHALSLCFRALLAPGETALVPAPAYFFAGPIEAAGGRAVYVHGREEDGWRWDLDAIERALDARTRVIVACNPGNPTGYLPSADEVAGLAALAERHGVTLLADEAYERYVYEGRRLASVLDVAGEAVLVRSIGKSYAVPSWRLGYVVAPPDVVDRCVRALEVDCIRCPYVGQRVALAAVDGPQDWLADLAAEYERYRDAALAAVAGVGLSVAPPAAGPFLFVHLAGAGEEELLEAGIPAVPGRFFQAPGYARLPFGGADDALADALRVWAQSRSSVRT